MDDRDDHQLHGLQNMPSSSHEGHMLRTIQHLIEKCLTFFMDREECVQCLERTANLKPSITRIVWDELEKSNIEFFASYSKNKKEILNNTYQSHGATTHPTSSSSSNSSNLMKLQQENQKDND